MSQVFPTPPALMSGDLPLLYTLQIILRLRALRTSCGLSACPPRPPVNANENFVGLSIYPGLMTQVTNRNDHHFGSLGRLFFIIETRLNGEVVRKRAVFDNARIPRHILESDQELNELLVLRNTSIISPPSSRPHSAPVVVDGVTAASRRSLDEVTTQDVIRDDRVEVSEPRRPPSRHFQLNGRAQRKHAPYCIPHRDNSLLPSHDSHQTRMDISVTILVWSKESYRQATVALKIENGRCMTLSMVSGALAELFEGFTDSADIERLKEQRIDLVVFPPELTMPKVTSTPKSSPKTSTRDLKQAHTKKIVARLMAIRASRSMTMYPPEPVIDPNVGTIVRKGLFNGSTHEVNSPLHPEFRKLGMIFWVVEKVAPDGAEGEKKEAHIIYDTAVIPVTALLADRSLMRYLELRAAVRTFSKGPHGGSSSNSSLPSSPDTRSTASVPSSALPFPVTPDMSRTLDPSTPNTSPAPGATASVSSFSSSLAVTPGLSRVLVPSTPDTVMDTAARDVSTSRFASSNKGCQHDEDDEVEFVGFLHPSGAILPERPAPQVTRRKQSHTARKANANAGGNSADPTPVIVASSITVNIVAWAADTFKHQAVKLPLASGQYMRLSMVSKVLRRLQLDINGELDRFIPKRGWTPILMDTLFMVQDGDVVSLKSSAVQEIRDFEIQMAHLY
ncbi:hypothetical protein C8R42DRAFT_648420 [Lentinula raphanica]|nr:hypothetical protein C8R42DRAFT_648420 [Lentinula raphanica]